MNTLDALLEKYEDPHENVGLEDAFLLVEFILEQSVTLDAAVTDLVRRDGEPDVPEEISGVYIIEPDQPSTKALGVITIGVHGNEIYAGALCVLEALLQQRQGHLAGTVIVHIGNEKACRGYINHFDPAQYFLDRNGWRETNGMPNEVQVIRLDNGETLEVLSDFNRIPNDLMQIESGLHYNIDRGQELVWLHRAYRKGCHFEGRTLICSGHGAAYDIKFILHPHTSRMVGGIRNISLTKQGSEAFLDGDYDAISNSLPPELRIFLKWKDGGLGGLTHKTLNQHLEDDNKEIDGNHICIITIEFGNHEDIRPDAIKGLQDLCGFTIKNMLLNNGITQEDTKTLPIIAPIFMVETEPKPANVMYFDGAEALQKGDVLVLVCEDRMLPFDQEYIARHFKKSLLVDEHDVCEIVDTVSIQKDEKKRVFYAMPHFELAFILSLIHI